MRIHFDRMEPVVGRIARQLETHSSQKDGFTVPSGANGSDLHAINAMSTFGSDFGGHGDLSLGLETGNAFANGLNFDITNAPGSTDLRGNGPGNSFETFQLPDFLPDEMLRGSFNTQQPPAHQVQLQSQVSASAAGAAVPTTTTTTSTNILPAHDQTKFSSPLLCQLFNNEILSRSIDTPSILAEKIEMMSFTDTKADATDAEKLLSTISSEPYLLEVLAVSTVSVSSLVSCF